VLDDQGEVMYIIYSAEDVTDKVKAAQKEDTIKRMEGVYNLFTQMPVPFSILKDEDLVRESNEKFSNLLEAIPQITWTNLPGGEANFYNQQWYIYTGLTYEQSIEWGWKHVIHPDDLESTLAAYSKSLQTGKLFVSETRFRRNDGQYRWHLSRSLPIKNEQGVITLWVGTATDIHDRKVAEDALKQSEQQIRSLVESAPFPIGVYIGKEMRIQLANQSILDTWGKGNDVIGKTYFEVLPELKNQNIYWQLDAVFETGLPYHAKNQRVDLVMAGQLKTFYFNYSFTPLFNAAGDVYGIMNTAADVTDLAMAKQQIEESEQNLHNIILQAPVAMCILKGPEFIVEISNERMFEIWGKSGEELLHKPIFVGLPEAKEQGFEKLLDTVYTTGETFSANAVPITLPRNGKLENVYLNFVYEAFKENNGEISAIMAVAIEVTEQVMAQMKIEEIVARRTKELAEANEALVRANQDLINSNESLEQFAYAASHDMQEPLRKIETFSDFLEKESAGQLSERGRSFIGKIASSASRMKTIINDLLQYANQKFDGIQQNVDLNEVVAQVETDLEITIHQNNVHIYADPLPTIYAVKGQINQLFYNLIGNSIKFARKDTPSQIHITSKMLSPAEVQEKTILNRERQYVQLVFTDNGIGFGQEYAEKIFQLFTRLHGKSEYEGTGIGLGLCRKIVQNHKGDIYAVSEPGKGSAFYVILPVA